jgi:hypothetical protein
MRHAFALPNRANNQWATPTPPFSQNRAVEQAENNGQPSNAQRLGVAFNSTGRNE